MPWNEAASAQTTYAYDVRDNLIEVRDAQGNHTTLIYNELGQKTAMSGRDRNDP